MRSRLWAAGAAVWTAVFLVLAYVRFHPQLWYALLLATAGVLAAVAAAIGTDGRGRTLVLVTLVALIVAALLGGWTAGPVLLPAVVACVLSVASSAANRAAPRR